mmetsp:Transcript_8192/g.12823  ORF Transcript_8192/g.12823 Transcript_8192/m.12823 type:complete len:226 (-) Transcript_8192:928-1605(-)
MLLSPVVILFWSRLENQRKILWPHQSQKLPWRRRIKSFMIQRDRIVHLWGEAIAIINPRRMANRIPKIKKRTNLYWFISIALMTTVGEIMLPKVAGDHACCLILLADQWSKLPKRQSNSHQKCRMTLPKNYGISTRVYDVKRRAGVVAKMILWVLMLLVLRMQIRIERHRNNWRCNEYLVLVEFSSKWIKMEIISMLIGVKLTMDMVHISFQAEEYETQLLMLNY